jgi:hypothetical protein
MTMITKSGQLDRRALLAGGIASLLLGVSNESQAAELDGAKLKLLIERALKEKDTTPLSRPSLVGLPDTPLTTKSIEVGDKIHKLGFMVIIPRRADGLGSRLIKSTIPGRLQDRRTPSSFGPTYRIVWRCA